MKKNLIEGRWPIPGIVLLFFGVALWPRVAGLADFVTTDEAYHWIDRTERFSQAIQARNWIDTLQTGHPGVSLMWLGSIGLWLESWFGHQSAGVPALIAHLAWLRLPPAVFEALVVPAGYLILRRLIAPAAALCAGLLWATSPYLVAHSRLLHLDALLTAFVTLSVLVLALAMRSEGRLPWRSLLASGVCAGFALLTKGPALILLPFAGLAMLVSIWRRERPARSGDYQAVLARTVLWYSVWLGMALLVVLAMWPALWADPGRALIRYAGEITDNGGRPNGDGQFFFGQANADPGPLFYLVADLFRTTPAMLLGLLAVPLAFGARQPGRAEQGRFLLMLALLALFWTLVMTLGPKKFDRYVLPAWPALLILAGSGLAALGARLAMLFRQQRAPVQGVLFAMLLAAETVQLAWFHPYYLSYYNPLLGGGRVAQNVFLIGWGEGMDQVGAYLQTRSDLAYGPVLSALGATLQPFVAVDVRDVADFGSLPANYAVVYLESVQRAANPPLYERLQTTVPLHRVIIHGIEYARIYQLPRPFETPLDATFGDSLRLRGVTITHDDATIAVTPAWDVRAHPDADLHVFVHVLDVAGTRVAQIDVAPGGGNAPPTSQWQAGQQIAVPLPINLATPLPPGRYAIVMGVYDVATNQRITLRGGPAVAPELDGDHALLVGHISVP